MSKSFHKEEFDEGTKVKLEILRLYISGWLPVFLSRKEIYWNSIYLYDFFAGAGTDSVGNFGSPLIIINELKKYCQKISEKNIKVTLLLNEFDPERKKSLENSIREFVIKCREKREYSCCDNCAYGKCPFSIELDNQDFHNSFEKVFPKMIMNPELPRFMFLDQFGIKQITPEVFLQLISLIRTDILFFISSSFFRRFAEMPGFSSYLDISREVFDQSKPSDCHRVIYNYYISLIPQKVSFFMSPFSIKKAANIYGLIFGSHNLRGLEIFLNAAWSIDKNTGEANFNIDNDRIIGSGQLSIFEEENKIKKINQFEERLTSWLKSGIKNNKIIYQFTLENGFKPQHASSILYRLEKEGMINVLSTNGRKKYSYYLSYSTEKILFITFNDETSAG